jgi:DNA polymerase III delta prime subunit
MLRSLLIVGGNKEKRWQFALKIARENLEENQIFSHPDFFSISGTNSIGIEQIRDLEKKLALKPYKAKIKIAIINEAEKLTLPAQNALLKTLEEPPENSLIILTAAKKDLLLPTIISRCRIIRLREEIELEKNSLEIPEIQGKRVGECLKIAALYCSGKNEAIAFCQQLLLKERESFLNKPSVKKVRNIRYILKTIKFLESNVNPALTTGNLLLKLVK